MKRRPTHPGEVLREVCHPHLAQLIAGVGRLELRVSTYRVLPLAVQVCGLSSFDRMMERILCVCVGNISRSPMMQVVLQQLLGATFLVESAGMRKELAGRPANYHSVACMKERGVDLGGHISRWIGDLDLDQYRWIVCVGRDEADTVRAALSADSAGVIVANEQQSGIPDPYESGMAGYQNCLALLDEVMPEVAKRIRDGYAGCAHKSRAPS